MGVGSVVTIDELREMLARMGPTAFDQSMRCCGLLGLGVVDDLSDEPPLEITRSLKLDEPPEEHTKAFLSPTSSLPERPPSQASGVSGRIWLVPFSNKPLLVGRAPTCDVSISEEWISHRHLFIHFRSPTSVVLQDAGALNGTWVKGARLRAGEMKEIADGNSLVLGKSLFTFCYPRRLLALAAPNPTT